MVFNTGADQVTVTTASGGAIVEGSVTGAYAAPVIGGTVANPIYLATPYFSTGGSPGAVTLTFAQEQDYLGFLWGSIGSGDTISFYEGTQLLASYTGVQAAASAPGYSAANASQGFNGSEYTLMNLSGGTFDKVVLSQSGSPSFETADFEYAATNQLPPTPPAPVPEPSSAIVFASGGVALIIWSIRQRRYHEANNRPFAELPENW